MKNLAAVLRRDGAPQAESRSPDIFTPHDFQSPQSHFQPLFPHLVAGAHHRYFKHHHFFQLQKQLSNFFSSPNLIFLQIRFIIILQKMRSRKLKKLLKRRLLLLNVKINEVGLSKIDFFKFLCYNIYRKMKEVKLNYPKNYR